MPLVRINPRESAGSMGCAVGLVVGGPEGLVTIDACLSGG